MSLGAASAEAVTVDYAEGTGGTAASGTDYTAPASGTLTFAADETSKTIAVSVTGDATDEPDETVVVTLGNASGATVGTGTGTGTITDDDAAPTVTLSLADDSIPENGGATTVSATLSHPSSAATTITIAPVADAYTVGSDGTITIAAGDTANASDTAAISAVDNDTGEADRSVTVTGAADNAQGIGQVTGASLTLEDDDGGPTPAGPTNSEPTVSINSPSVAEGAAGTTATLTFTVSLGAASTEAVTVDYAEGTGGTAASGTDYTALASGTLTFAADETSKTIAVSVTGDATDEPDETVVVALGNASGATVGTGTGTGTITDDDAAPTVTLSLADDSIPENGGATTVSATLSHPSSAATTITITAVADAYTVGSDATITIAAGDTANASDTAAITAVDNDTGEADRSVTVTGSAGNTQGIGQVTGASLTLEDDDGGAGPTGPSDSEPTVSINSPSVAEGAAGTAATLTFTVSLDAAGTEAVTVDYAEGTGGTAESGADYTALASGTLTFAADETSKTIAVSVTGDATDEPDETVVVTLGNASGATVGTGTGTGTITDDDAAPTVTLSLADDSISENGGATTVSATLSHPSSAATTITITPVADAYTVGSDATITIAAGDTANASDTAAINAVDNDTGEADRSVTVTGSADNAQGIGQVTGASLTLEDDDGGADPAGPTNGEPTVSINSPSVAEGAAGTTATLTFTVSLDATSDGEVTVDYAEGTGGTAGSGTDYTAPASGTLTFAAGDTSRSIAVSVAGDATDEPDETVVLTLGNASGATVGTGTGTGTITDDDAAPTVTLALADDSIPENGGATTVSATLSHPSSAATTITISPVADAYTVGSDATITIAAGDTANAPDTATINAVDNDTGEADRSVTVTGSANNGQGIGQVTGASLTLEDDDGGSGPTEPSDDEPTMSLDSPSVSEGAAGTTATLTFTVSLSAASAEAVTVDYAVATGGTATAGTDYAAPVSGTLTIAAGDTGATIAVTVIGDGVDEPDETILMTLGEPAGATLGTGTGIGTGTIADDDAAPTVTLSLADDSISENGGTTTVSATLSHPSSEATVITISPVADAYEVGSLAVGLDATITIAAGSTANPADTAVITAVDNATDEANRSVTVIGSASNAQGAGPVTGAGLTLLDDDGEPSLTINAPSVTEGDSGSASLIYTVTLSPAGTEAVTVDYAEGTGGTAESGADYTAPASGTLTFAVGDTSKSITVSVTGDTTDEPDETVVVTLGNASGATIGTGTGTGTITDDDAAPTVTLALADDSIPENGGATTVSATLSHPSSAATTITITPVADAYTVGSDATITIAAGDTANASDTAAITAVDNDTGEADRSVTVTGSAGNAQGIGQVTGASLTLEDDDGGAGPAGPTNGEPTVSINSPSVSEGAAGTTATLTFTVSLGAASDGEVTVDYAEGTGGTAESGTDYTAPASGTLTFAVGDTSRSITVSVTGDTTDEPDETVVVTLGNASGATIGTGTGTGTITDDDAAPTVTLALADDSIPENGGSTTVSATLSHPSSADTTITITAVADAYTVGSDGTITIAAGDTANASDTAAISAVDNDTGEADRSVTVTGSANNAQGIGQVTGASLTLEDDDGGSGPTEPSDDEPTMSIDSPSVAEGAAGTMATLTFTVSLGAASAEAVTVDYAVATGGDGDGGDGLRNARFGNPDDRGGGHRRDDRGNRYRGRGGRAGRNDLDDPGRTGGGDARDRDGDGDRDDHGRRRGADGDAVAGGRLDPGERRHDDGFGDAGQRLERSDHDHDRGAGGRLHGGGGRHDHHPRRGHRERLGHGDDHGGGQRDGRGEPERHGYRLREQHAGGGSGNGSGPDAPGRRRGTVTDDQRAGRYGGRRRFGVAHLHGNAESGERRRGNGGLRGGDGRDGDFGHGLHGARFGNAHLRGGGHEQDDHGVGNGRHDGRAGRNGGGDARQRLGGDGRDGFGDGDDHGRRRGADGDAVAGGRFDPGERRLDHGLGHAEPPVERRHHDHDHAAGERLHGGFRRDDHHRRRGHRERLGHGGDQRGGQRHRGGGPERHRHRFGGQYAGNRPDNRREPDPRRRRRAIVAHDQRAERYRGGQRFRVPHLHGNAESGEHRRGNGGLRGGDGRDGGFGDGLHGAGFGNAHLRGGGHEQDDHGVGNG